MALLNMTETTFMLVRTNQSRGGGDEDTTMRLRQSHRSDRAPPTSVRWKRLGFRHASTRQCMRGKKNSGFLLLIEPTEGMLALRPSERKKIADARHNVERCYARALALFYLRVRAMKDSAAGVCEICAPRSLLEQESEHLVMTVLRAQLRANVHPPCPLLGLLHSRSHTRVAEYGVPTCVPSVLSN